MEPATDRFRVATGIALAATLAAGAVLALGVVTGTTILRNVAVSILLVGAVVFAPTYLLYASWVDEFGDRRL